MKELYEQIKKFLLLGLDFLLADPADKERIKTLQEENARLIQELAEAHADDLTEEQKTELNSIFDRFAEATPAPPTEAEHPADLVSDDPSGAEGEPASEG